ncbi:beta strand repeat-containing protein [Chthoniobacter flavus]|uniref:beta strand repeat-containing protein n=1 Tax=Chthoniobacter flavus TaxID=191863 RepID=UPI0014045B23|nr:autotransporter-associated beta strand repeat-containing protein [Chthoniobacter flavus]
MLTPWLVRRLSSWLILSTVLTVGVAQIAQAATRTFDGGTTGTGNALDTATNWVGDTLPGSADEALLDNSVITLPSTFSVGANLTFGDLIWNANSTASIAASGSSNRVITLSEGGGGTAAVAAGGAATDVLVMGSSATSNTLTIGGGSGTGQLSISITKAGNIDVVSAGATLTLTAAVSGAVGLTKTGLGTLVLAGVNTFGGTANNFTISTGTVQMSGAGTLGSQFTDLVVNANLDLNGTTQNVDALSGNSAGSIYNNANGTAATLTIGNDNGGGTFSGVISDNTNSGTGTLALTKIGTATETINSTQTYSGATTINVGYIGNISGAGSLSLSNNTGRLLNSDVTVNGATFAVTSNAAGTITRAKSLTLNDATFNITGNSAGNAVESVTNALTLGGGRSTVTLAPNSARNVQFTAASLARSPGATILVRGTSFGVNSIASTTINAGNITFTTAPTLSGSGSVGTPTVGIIPWAYGDNSNSGTGTDFLTYDSTNGLRRLTSSEYVTTFANGNSSLVNAKITNVIGAINGATSLNSLTLGTLGRINGTGTLSISSGGILALDNVSIGTIEAGTVDFGTADGILLPIAGKTLSIGSAITGSGGLTAGGAGTAVLTGVNSYSGGTNLSGGVLNINGDAALGAVPGAPATNLTFSGGTLQASAVSVALSSNRNVATTVANVNAGFDTNGNSMSVAGSINGIGGINKLGNGVLTLSGTNGYTGQTFATRGTLNVTGSLTSTSSLVLVGGGVTLDFSGANAPATNIVNSAASLALNIGATSQAGVNTLTIQGKDNAGSAQTFSSTTFANFASHINLTPGAGTGTLTVNLGPILRATPTTNATTASNPVGATLDITIPTGVTVTGSASTTNNMIVGVTVNGNTWATVSSGKIVGYTAYSSSFSTSGANLDVTTSGTLTADAGTLRFNTAAANTVTLGGTNGVRDLGGGGVLVTSAVGTNLSTITGGVLQGLGRRDIIFIQNNTAGDLEVDSVITDNGGLGNEGITKSGAGRLILTASNSNNGPTVINEGTIVVTGNYVPSVSLTGSMASGSNQITGIADTSALFIGEKVTSSVTNSSTVNTTWVVTAIDSVNGTVTLSSNGTGALAGGTFSFSGGSGLGAATSGNTVSVAQGATLQIGNGTANGNLFLNQVISSSGSVIFDRSDAFSYGNVISGTGSVTQEGSGPLTLTATNTYTGATVVGPNSTLIAGSTGAFGANSAANVAATGTLEFNGKSMTLGSLTGGGNIENDNATTAITLTIGSDNISTNFSGALNDGAGSSAMAVTKIGTGTQTLSGTNTFTGNFLVNGGTANISGALAAPLFAGGGASVTGIVNILPGASINANVTSLLPSIGVATGTSSTGAIYQSGGDVTFNAEFILASNTNAYGFYDMSGGTLSAPSNSTVGPNERFRLGGASNNSFAVFYQSGGTITLPTTGSANFEVGGNAGGPVTGAVGVGYFTGGSLVTGLANHIGVDGSTGAIRGEETIAGTAQVTVNGVATLGQTAGDVGILNLIGGTYSVKQIVKGTNGTGWVNFNGGTLKAASGANSGSFFNGLSSVNVFSGGGTIDTNGQAITIGQPLLAPNGSGVTTIPVSYGGVGYIGAPYISITGGGGTGATAVANMVDDGSGNGTFKIASITITNPGVGYTGAPTVAVNGGGGSGAILGTPVTTVNTSGGITKQGAGTLTLNGNNTYTGITQVTQGTLLVTGSLTGSVDAKNGTAIGGTGTIFGATIESGATLLGGNGTTATGTLTSSSDVSLASNSIIQLTLGGSGAHSSLARTGGNWVFDSNQEFSFTLAGANTGTYDNIITGLTGTEAGLSNIANWTIVTPGVVGTFSLDASDNVDLTISAIPEPSAFVSLLASFGTLAGMQRLRRRRS